MPAVLGHSESVSATSCIFQERQHFHPYSRVCTAALECMLPSVADQHLSNRAQTLDSLLCAFFIAQVLISPAGNNKNGKSTDINTHELYLSPHLK